MKFNLFFMLLLCLYGHFNVKCDRLTNWVWGAGPSGPVSGEIALILAVDKNGLTYLANNQFVAKNMNRHYDRFLFLCPAETPEDWESNKSSRTKNLLFVKEIQKNDDIGKNDIVGHTCVNPVKPSVIKVKSLSSDSAIDFYFVGYEADLSEDSYGYSHNIVHDHYHRFKLGITGFEWFNLYTIAFNRNKRSVAYVLSHSLAYRNSKMQLPGERQLDYTLGMKEIFGDIDMTRIYTKEYQDLVFNSLYMVGSSVPYKYLDRRQGRFLVPVHLAHLDSFGIPLLKQAGKTYANIAPMWIDVYNQAWSKVEKNLDALALGVNAIHVITGVYGILEFNGIEFYLRPDRTIEVPAAFFKIVSYSPNNEEKYNMVIVTNNNPYVGNDTNEKICRQNQCQIFGWNDAQQDEPYFGRTSCCQLTDEVLTELKLQDYSRLVDKPLDLYRVPHWQNHELTLNMKAYMSDQINGVVNDKWSDDDIYKNGEKLMVEHEKEEVTFNRFLTTLYENYVRITLFYQ